MSNCGRYLRRFENSSRQLTLYARHSLDAAYKSCFARVADTHCLHASSYGTGIVTTRPPDTPCLSGGVIHSAGTKAIQLKLLEDSTRAEKAVTMYIGVLHSCCARWICSCAAGKAVWRHTDWCHAAGVWEYEMIQNALSRPEQACPGWPRIWPQMQTQILHGSCLHALQLPVVLWLLQGSQAYTGGDTARRRWAASVAPTGDRVWRLPEHAL